jgi:succinyl-diaminopimelate desuccinylase
MYSTEEATRITSDLIKIPSVRDDKHARKTIIEYVRSYFKDSGVYIKEFEHNDVYSIIVTLKREKNPSLLLNGHLDVVPGNAEQFKPYIKGKRLYGRGSGDMKGGVAIMMMVLKTLAKEKKRPSVGLMLTTDEEVGGANGVGYLVEKKGYGADTVIIPDGGKDLGEIILKQKGVLHIKVTARGVSTHGSRPFFGENAIEKLFTYYREIQKIIPPITERIWKTTVNLGKIEGGKGVNVVPDHAEMHLDIRVVRRGEKERLLTKIKKLIGGKNVSVLAEGEPFIQNRTERSVRLYADVAEEVLGKKISFGQVEGASDGRYFSAKGIPTIITKINCEHIHGDDEWIDTAQMEQFYRILMRVIERSKI